MCLSGVIEDDVGEATEDISLLLQVHYLITINAEMAVCDLPLAYGSKITKSTHLNYLSHIHSLHHKQGNILYTDGSTLRG